MTAFYGFGMIDFASTRAGMLKHWPLISTVQYSSSFIFRQQ